MNVKIKNLWYFLISSLIVFNEVIIIVLENYDLSNTKVKIHNDYIATDINSQKKYINTVFVHLLKKISIK